SQLTSTTPTQSAINANANNLDGDRFRAQWTNGNGARRIVIARTENPVNVDPIDGISYNAAAFGLGDQIGLGNFVVYEGNSSVATITGLEPSTTYYFKVFEYNGTGQNTYYQTVDPAESFGTTLSAPTVNASNVNFTDISGNSLRINWTNGNGGRRL